MNNYDKNEESSQLKYCDINYLYGWAMSQKLSVNGLKWVKDLSKFNELFIKSYNEESDVRNFLKVDVQQPENLNDLDIDLMILHARMKIEKKKKKKNLITDLYGKTEYVIHIRNLKQALNHGLVLKEIHKIIKFKQNYTYKIIHMNTKLLKKAKNDFEKNFFKLMNNSVFGKTMKFKVKQSKDVEKKFDTSNYELERPLLIGKKKKVVILIKSELGGKIMKEFVGLRAKHIAL